MSRQGRIFNRDGKPATPKLPPAPKKPETTEPVGRKGKTFPGLRTKPRPVLPVEAGRRGQVFEANLKKAAPAPKQAAPAEEKPKAKSAPVHVGRQGRVFGDQKMPQVKPAAPKLVQPKPAKKPEPKADPVPKKQDRKTAEQSPLSKEPVARIPTGIRGGIKSFRYWRLRSNSNQKGNWSYHEIGLACEYPFVNNIALAEYGVTADTNSDNGGNNPAECAIDGKLSTHWSTNVLRDHSQAWWSCDLKHAQAIRAVKLVIGPYWPGTSGLDIEGSNDNENWTLVKTITGMNPASFDATLTYQIQ